MLNRIVTALVFSGLLISVPTSAAPDGSLREMLDTKITLIEYITLHTKLKSVERLATGDVTEWGDYSSVVKLSAWFDYDDSELGFDLSPVDDHYFSTVAEAKSYCRGLIKTEQRDVWLTLLFYTTPNGWGRGGLGTDGFYEQLYKSSKIRVSIDGRQILEEELPEGEYFLRCKASLDDEGEVKNFSYNL
jgi:hypothetical protein